MTETLPAVIDNTPLDPDDEVSVPLANPTEFAIRNMKQLMWAGKMAAESRLFGAVTAQQAQVIMWKSARLGVDPLIGLEHIHVINNKPRPDGFLTAFLIKRSPRVRAETWTRESNKERAKVSVTLRNGVTHSMEVKIGDIAAHDKQKTPWQHYPDRMLYWRAVELLGATYFEDALLGMLPIDTGANVIDVAKVERELPAGEKSWPCTADCGGRMFLHSNPKGGVYLRCANCNATDVPPPEVRDLVRSTPAALTIAASNDTKKGEPTELGSTAHTQDRAQSGPDRAERSSAEAAAPPASSEEVMPPATERPAVPADTADVTPPPSDAPVDAAEKDGGAYDPPSDYVDGSGDAVDTSAIPPEPVADTPSLTEAAAAPTEAAASPREQLRAFLRENRTATGVRKTAIRDALLDAGWDGTTGITDTVNTLLTDDAIDTLLTTFARPGFGTIE